MFYCKGRSAYDTQRAACNDKRTHPAHYYRREANGIVRSDPTPRVPEWRKRRFGNK